MAIKDWDGTTTYENKKAVDWDGTTSNVLNKGWDWDGTTSNLFFSGTPDYIFKDGDLLKEPDVVKLKSSSSGTASYALEDTYIRLKLSYYGHYAWLMWILDVTEYITITMTYEVVANHSSAQKYLSCTPHEVNSTTNPTWDSTQSKYQGVASKATAQTGTLEIDVSSLQGEHYIGIGAYQEKKYDDIHVTSIIFTK